MFCNKCGAALDQGSVQCSRCGAAVVGSTQSSGYQSPASYPSKLERRLPVVAVFWIVYGVFEAIKAAAAHFLLRFSGFWVMGPDWMGVWGLGWIVAWALLSAVLALIAAWGLYERRPWGRTAGIISAVFALVHPLFGTVLGIYTLVLLLSGEAADQYARLARA